MKRITLRIGTTLALTLLLAAAFATLATGAGAAECGDNVLNVNLGSKCASVVELKVLDAEPNAKATACEDGTGCAGVASPTVPKMANAPAPPASRPKAVPPKPVVVAAPVVHHTYRINAFDEADGESFYSGDFRVRLPYPAQDSIVSPLPPTRRSFAEGWGIPAIPREALFPIIGGLMLLASAGGLRRIMTTV